MKALVFAVARFRRTDKKLPGNLLNVHINEVREA